MKSIKTLVAILTLSMPPLAAEASVQAQEAMAVREPEWVCYYDRDTYQLKFCRWE